MKTVQLGCQRILNEEINLIDNCRVGLITNHSGVDPSLIATVDKLHASEKCKLVALFGPEHGIRGAAQDGEKVDTFVDLFTGIPVYSLYGKTRRPDKEMLDGIDRMIFDIQDVGSRFYTFLYTMSMSMEVCAQHNIPFVILDRPNPIGGKIVSGNVLDVNFASFVGRYPIAIRYGLTIGELARYLNEKFSIGTELHIVQMKNWNRNFYWADCGIPWIPPSPNMPTADTAILYPGTCFFEGTNISEGRGTAKPFEQFGAPFINGIELAKTLNNMNLQGVCFRPVFFTPTTSKYSGTLCSGVQAHITQRDNFDPIATGFASIITIRSLYCDNFSWRLPKGGIHNFDRLAGTDKIRNSIEAGCSADELLTSWNEEIEVFKREQQDYQIYN